MTATRPGRSVHPKSLAQAQEMASRLWPGRDAPPAAWLEFHQAGAVLFARAAQADPGHQHEARYLASVEREEADRIGRALETGSADTGAGGRVSGEGV